MFFVETALSNIVNFHLNDVYCLLTLVIEFDFSLYKKITLSFKSPPV